MYINVPETPDAYASTIFKANTGLGAAGTAYFTTNSVITLAAGGDQDKLAALQANTKFFSYAGKTFAGLMAVIGAYNKKIKFQNIVYALFAGLWVLAAAGHGYSMRKIHSVMKKAQIPQETQEEVEKLKKIGNGKDFTVRISEKNVKILRQLNMTNFLVKEKDEKTGKA